MKKKQNFADGPIFWRLILFALPIMATSIMQILYGMISQIVVGQFSGDPNALGAIGSTSSLSAFITNIMIGTSSGAGVVVAQAYGAGKEEETSRAVGASVFVSLCIGVGFSLCGLLCAEPVLNLLGTKEIFMPSAVPYIRIIMLGIPGLCIYNFAASVLRSVGDSHSPLIAISISGAATVLLNLLFIGAFGWGVIGAALATIIAEYISCIYVLLALLMKKGAPYRLLISNIRPSGAYIRRILRYGVPAGLQSSCFSLSGLITTSAINSFPETTVTAGAIAQNLDNITDTCIGAFIHSSMTFAAQNHGAGKRDRINKTLIYSLIQVVVTAVVITQTILLFAPQILSLFVEESDPMREVIISTAEEWLGVILPFYFTSGIMYVISGTLRGMGYAVGPMIMNLIGVCGARILWITVFFPMPMFNNLAGLLSVYPMSWTLTAILQGCIAVYAWIKMYKKKKNTPEQTEKREGVSVG